MQDAALFPGAHWIKNTFGGATSILIDLPQKPKSPMFPVARSIVFVEPLSKTLKIHNVKQLHSMLLWVPVCSQRAVPQFSMKESMKKG